MRSRLEGAWHGPGRLLAPKRTKPTNPQTAFGSGRWERPSPEMCPRRCGSGPCFTAPRPVGTRFLPPPHCHRNHSQSRGREGGAGGKARRSPSPPPHWSAGRGGHVGRRGSQPPCLPFPGVAPSPPSPGHGCRSSWTTVTLVRTMSRFDMA